MWNLHFHERTPGVTGPVAISVPENSCPDFISDGAASVFPFNYTRGCVLRRVHGCHKETTRVTIPAVRSPGRCSSGLRLERHMHGTSWGRWTFHLVWSISGVGSPFIHHAITHTGASWEAGVSYTTPWIGPRLPTLTQLNFTPLFIQQSKIGNEERSLQVGKVG